MTLRRTLGQMREMAQFGLRSYAELTDALSQSGEIMAEALPWVPFNTDGNLKVQKMPTSPDWGFEIARVWVDGDAIFPDAPSKEYMLPTIRQRIYVFSGLVIAHPNGVATVVAPGESLTILPGVWSRMIYKDAHLIFDNRPTLANEDLLELR